MAAKRRPILIAAVVAPAAGVFAAAGHRGFAIIVCAALLLLFVGFGVRTWLGWRTEGTVNSEFNNG